MNTTSDTNRYKSTSALSLGGILGVLLMAGCLQGPWDYVPQKPEIHRGLFLTAYAVADRPLEQVCIERLFGLNEESTQAFPFYENAQVEVEGNFGGGPEVLPLTPVPYLPNCFQGRGDALVQRGETYELRARIVWDSAGESTESRIRARAQVPTRFSVERTAEAPAPAFAGGAVLDFLDPNFLEALPENVRNQLLAEFGQEIIPIMNDSAAMVEYLEKNGPRLLKRTIELLGQNTLPFDAGDTLRYLDQGTASLLSHYYRSDRSEDVGGVLITQPYDIGLSRGVNSFSSLFGEPDTSVFFLAGNIRRLIFYPDIGGPDGWRILDRMGVVNAWYFIGPNRLYFYGIEPAYAKYMQTAVEGEEDSRVAPAYNALEGKGIFVGAVKDSFDLHIAADSASKVYPMTLARDAFCRESGWLSNSVCRSRYAEYCFEQNWQGDECRMAAVTECLAPTRESSVVDNLCSDGAPRVIIPTDIREAAIRRYCVANDFPTGEASCAEWKNRCHDEKGRNGCKETLWEFCLDNAWIPDQCRLGLVSYCFDRTVDSPVICREARKICAESPEENLCR